MAKKSQKKKNKKRKRKSADELLGKIQQGDCMDCFREVPDGSIDLVFADPPFNIGYEYDEYEDKLDSEKYVEWCSGWMQETHRILKSDGAFWLAIGDDYAAELKIAAQQAGFHTRNWVIWYYTFGVHCKSKFTRSHTHLFYFIKDPKRFTFNFSEVAVPSARQLVYNDKRANSAGRSPDDTWILRPQDCDGFGTDEDTWYFPRVAGTFKERAGFHGCQMPEQLLGRIIRACSDEGEIVLDPFTGSATTLAVAKKLKRNFMGFELSKEYVKSARKRLKSARIGDPLSGPAEPQKSAPKTRKSAAPKTPPTNRVQRKSETPDRTSPQLAFKLTEAKSTAKKAKSTTKKSVSATKKTAKKKTAAKAKKKTKSKQQGKSRQ